MYKLWYYNILLTFAGGEAINTPEVMLAISGRGSKIGI
jgi:hypothetical protein